MTQITWHDRHDKDEVDNLANGAEPNKRDDLLLAIKFGVYHLQSLWI